MTKCAILRVCRDLLCSCFGDLHLFSMHHTNCAWLLRTIENMSINIFHKGAYTGAEQTGGVPMGKQFMRARNNDQGPQTCTRACSCSFFSVSCFFKASTSTSRISTCFGQSVRGTTCKFSTQITHEMELTSEELCKGYLPIPLIFKMIYPS